MTVKPNKMGEVSSTHGRIRNAWKMLDRKLDGRDNFLKDQTVDEMIILNGFI